MSHTIKTFLSSRIHFLERYVLFSKIVGHKITMNSKWFYIQFQAVEARIQAYRNPLHQRTLHYDEILGGSYINRLHLKTGCLKY